MSTIKQLPSNPNILEPIDPGKIQPVPDDPFDREAVNDLINVYLKDHVDIASFSESIQKKYSNHSISPTYFAEEYKRIQFRVDPDSKMELMENIRSEVSDVKYVTHEWIFQQGFRSLNDPDFRSNNNYWFYETIGLYDAWSITMGDTSIKIAVIDDGFDLNHKELKNQYIKPWNVFEYSSNVFGVPNVIFHGTHVAATVLGEANNNFGIAGVAPKCKLIPIQIADKNGIITITSILDGLFYALKNKADVINLSLGFSLGPNAANLSPKEQQEIINTLFKDEEELWSDVFAIALKENCVIVQAAGNDNVIAAIDPMKRNSNCITVGATNNTSNKTDFSNYGNVVSAFAPGQEIYSALPNNNMGYLDGTSMASPIVAGCVGLIKTIKPDLTSKEIIELIVNQAKNDKYNMIRIDQILSSL
jgi:subtilisin family serine protease